MILILRSLPPGPNDGVTGRSVGEGPGIVGPGPGGHPSIHPQWLFRLKVCQMISINLVIYRVQSRRRYLLEVFI